MPPGEERVAGFPHPIEKPLCIKGQRGSHPEEQKKFKILRKSVGVELLLIDDR